MDINIHIALPHIVLVVPVYNVPDDVHFEDRDAVIALANTVVGYDIPLNLAASSVPILSITVEDMYADADA